MTLEIFIFNGMDDMQGIERRNLISTQVLAIQRTSVSWA